VSLPLALSLALGLSFFYRLPIAQAAEPVAAESPALADEPHAEPLTLRVQELRQQATVFVPKERPAALSERRRPAVVVLHPGFLGDDATSREIARALWRRGVIVVMPAYRGQKRALDGEVSDGHIEFCSGEVDDAQRAVEWLRARKDVDPFRIGLLGMSHGGCIALRTAVREPRLRAVVTFSAPVAAEPVISHLEEHPFGFFLYNGILAQQLKRYIHGPPRSEPGSYAVRSPLFLSQKLTMPLFIVHGARDQLVPTSHACWLARALKHGGRSVVEQWLTSDGTRLPGTANRCGLGAPQPPEGAPPPRTELWLVEGQDHIFFSKRAKQAAQERAVAFLLEELTR
jgi:dienelactone hydrolase